VTTQQKIRNLKSNESVEISRVSPDRYCTAERSGDGNRLRFVRHYADGFVVFQNVNF